MSAMLKWKEHVTREKQGKTVKELVSSLQIEKNRYYIESIFDVIKFLVINEVPFRGTNDNDDKITYSRGKFQALLAYTIEKDQKLKDIAKTIPENAKYTSPEIQNNIIHDMASISRDRILSMVKNSDSNCFTLKCDGTRDKTMLRIYALYYDMYI